MSTANHALASGSRIRYYSADDTIAHVALAAAVLNAYGFHAQNDLLVQLLELNFDVARRIDRGDPVTAPGVPADYPDPAQLVTDDCIQP